MNTSLETPQHIREGDWVRVVALPPPAPFVADAFNRRAPAVGDIAQLVDVRDQAPEYELECRDADRIEWLQSFAAGEVVLEKCAAPATEMGGGKRTLLALAGLAIAALLAAMATPWVRTVIGETGAGAADLGFLELLLTLEDRADIGQVVMVFLALFTVFLAGLYFALEGARSYLRARRR